MAANLKRVGSENLKKAGTAIKKSFRTSRYNLLGGKENVLATSSPKWTSRRSRASEMDAFVEVDEVEFDEHQANSTSSSNTAKQSKTSAVTQSMKEAVVNIRQKLRMSTRRRVSTNEKGSPTKVTKRRQSFGGVRKAKHDVKMSSPFFIDTPTRNRNQIKTCISLETPTRLRKEVEALTANMKAMSALTPNTLKTRSVNRKSPPMTNGSLKTPRSHRRRITTEI